MNSFYAVFYIEQRKDPHSKYQDYLNSLPHDISNFPELFNEEEMGWLQGSHDILEAIAKKIDATKEEYEILCGCEPPL